MNKVIRDVFVELVYNRTSYGELQRYKKRVHHVLIIHFV